MADISKLFFWRHLRGEPSSHLILHKDGRLREQGPGASFWFYPLSASIAEIPLDDRELPFLFHGRSRDFQDVTTQGVITFRIVDPDRIARRIDFSIDLDEGAYTKQPMEKMALLLTQLAQQSAWEYVAANDVREVLANGIEPIRTRVREALTEDPGLEEMGLEIVSVRVSSIKPTADLERALQMPAREAIQQTADEATFERRAQAVQKERAIQENELQNRIELAKREELLINQKGQNEKRRTLEQAEAQRIGAEAAAQRSKLEADANAESIRVVELAKVNAEKQRMDIYKELPPQVIMGLAAQELAGKLTNIEHLSISPELLGPLFTNLVQAGTRRLEAGE
jgi:regulator of protease activity HflC (stomatin/prohibitin superfamily)